MCQGVSQVKNISVDQVWHNRCTYPLLRNREVRHSQGRNNKTHRLPLLVIERTILDLGLLSLICSFCMLANVEESPLKSTTARLLETRKLETSPRPTIRFPLELETG